VACLAAIPSIAFAQNIGHDALPSVIRVPVAAETVAPVTIAITGGYGYTEGVLERTDSHQRFTGALAVAAHPLPWLSAALRLDGRVDTHQTAQGGDSGIVGDPRVFVRVHGRVAPFLRIAAQAGLWIPSDRLLGVNASALTPEILAVATIAPPRAPYAFTVMAGYRLDHSANSVLDPASLSPSDRLALGVSGFSTLLLGLGGAYRRGPIEWLAEGQWDLLLGAGAPSPMASPLHVRAGARFRPWSEQRFFVSLALDASPGARPDVSPGAALAPVDPRIGLWVSVGVGLPLGERVNPPLPDLHEPSENTSSAPPSTLADAPSAPPVAAQTVTAIRGTVVDEAGAPLADATITLRGPSSSAPTGTTNADGSFQFSALEPGNYDVVVHAERRHEVEQTVRVERGHTHDVNVAMERALPAGQVRGIVRAFSGDAVAQATVRIEQLGITQTTDANGEFQMDAIPGRYSVTISAPGFRAQSRRVDVHQNGVVVLNIDLQQGH